MLEQQNFNLKLQLYHSNLTKQSQSQQMSYTVDSNVRLNTNLSNFNSNSPRSTSIPIRSNSTVLTAGTQKIADKQYSNVPPDYYDLKAANSESKKKIESLETSVTLLKADLDALSGKQSSGLKSNDNNQLTPPRSNGLSLSYASPDHNSVSQSKSLLVTSNAVIDTFTTAFSSAHQTPDRSATHETNSLSSLIMEQDAQMIQSLNHQLSEYSAKYSKSASVIEYCMEQINGNKAEVSNYKQLVEEQSEQIRTLDYSKKEIAAQLETYKSAHNAQVVQTADILNVKASLEATIIQLNSSLDRLKSENSNLKSQCSEYSKAKTYFSNKCEFMEQRVLQLSSHQSQQRRADIENIRHEIFSRLEVANGLASAKLRTQQKLELDDILECIIEATTHCVNSLPTRSPSNDRSDNDDEDDDDDDSITHVRVVRSSKKDSVTSRRGSPAVSRSVAVRELQKQIEESHIKFKAKESASDASSSYTVNNNLYTNGLVTNRSLPDIQDAAADSSSSGLDATDYRRVIEIYK